MVVLYLIKPVILAGLCASVPTGTTIPSVPTTCKETLGFVIPIPTLPLLTILNTSPLPLLAVKISSAPPL